MHIALKYFILNTKIQVLVRMILFFYKMEYCLGWIKHGN